MSNKYRLDARSEEQFKKDIKSNHIVELEIAVRLCLYWFSVTGVYPKLEPNGVDYKGEFISDNKKINTDADFRINDSLIEITHADTFCKRYFHMKVPKMQRCINGDFKIVFVNGYKTELPKFVVMSDDFASKLARKAKRKYGLVPHPTRDSRVTFKESFRLDIGWFDNWMELPPMTDDLPEEYKRILNEIKGNISR